MKWRAAYTHMLLWGLYVLTEYLANMSHYRPWERPTLLLHIFLSLPVIIASTYFIAYFLVPRYLQQHKILPFVMSALVVAALVYLGRIFWLSLIGFLEDQQFFRMPPAKVLKNVIRDYAVIGLGVCLMIIGDWYGKDRQNRELSASKAEAELRLLRAQLHPHFLFNTLNNLYGLALQQSEKTAEGILKLSELLDYMLYHSQQEQVHLKKEVQLLLDYVQLEKMRYGDKLELELDIPEEIPEISIVPMLLLPLIENSFKHGRKGSDGKLHLQVKLETTKEGLIFEAENSISALPSPESKGGLGLENLKKRLLQIYPGRHQLLTEKREATFFVRLQLHFQ